MEFDSNNNVVKLCAEGMSLEGQGKPGEASERFIKAWNEATSDFEKFTAAHYVARLQKCVADKLRWDETSLQFALKIDDNSVKDAFPSLYLNIAKCYEDLSDSHNAEVNYQLALSFADQLPEDGYGKMIRGGITQGIERVTDKLNNLVKSRK